MTKQDLYEKIFAKILIEGSCEIKCESKSIPKLRTGLARARLAYMNVSGEHDIKIVRVSYIAASSVAKVSLDSSLTKEDTEFIIL